ncbi:MAG: hypothetical protein ACHP65_01055 [Legionellales bacterium]
MSDIPKDLKGPCLPTGLELEFIENFSANLQWDLESQYPVTLDPKRFRVSAAAPAFFMSAAKPVLKEEKNQSSHATDIETPKRPI